MSAVNCFQSVMSPIAVISLAELGGKDRKEYHDHNKKLNQSIATLADIMLYY